MRQWTAGGTMDHRMVPKYEGIRNKLPAVNLVEMWSYLYRSTLRQLFQLESWKVIMADDQRQRQWATQSTLI